MTPPDSPAGGPDTAAGRLAASREALRQAMRAASGPRHGASAGQPGGAGLAWLQQLKAMPGGTLIVEAVGSWWAQHPLRVASMVVGNAANAAVRPVAQRNPLGLVLGAVLLGGVLAWSRPWRWLVTPALFAGLLPQLFSKAMAMAPPLSWMAVLTSLMQDQGRPPAAPASSTAAPEAGPQAPAP